MSGSGKRRKKADSRNSEDRGREGKEISGGGRICWRRSYPGVGTGIIQRRSGMKGVNSESPQGFEWGQESLKHLGRGHSDRRGNVDG